MSAVPRLSRPGLRPLPAIGPVAEAFRGAMVESLGVPNKTPNVIRELLTEHFEGTDPESLPTLTDSYGTHLHLTSTWRSRRSSPKTAAAMRST